jgi:hypothetical protein
MPRHLPEAPPFACAGPTPVTRSTHGVSGTPAIIGHCTITLDGADVTFSTTALRVGVDGWVSLLHRDANGRPGMCTRASCWVARDGHVAVEYRYGVVTIEAS